MQRLWIPVGVLHLGWLSVKVDSYGGYRVVVLLPISAALLVITARWRNKLSRA